MKTAALWIYVAGNTATFVFLTFFDGIKYTWWSWLIILPLNEVLAAMWPIYWSLLRWLKPFL